ncbi:MAG: ABC transporter ATP-binding protein, partial [Pseudomonadota bacterium]
LLRLIAGLETPDAGTVALGGEDVTAQSPTTRNIAMVFQNYALYPHMTVAANIETPIAARRLTLAERLPGLRWLSPRAYGIRRAIRAEVQTLARALEIDALLARKPGQLSGGQRQRVALARAMIREPVAFLMDEPLSNLDAKLRVQMRAEIAALHRKLGVTFVYVTHDQAEAMSMSDRIAVMIGGCVLQVGDPKELYAAPIDIEVARFIGSPAINEYEAKIVEPNRIEISGSDIALTTSGYQASGPVTVAIRPEALSIGSNPREGEVVLATGQIESVEWLGAEVLLHLRGTADAGRPWVVRSGAAEYADLCRQCDSSEKSLRISVRVADLHVFDVQGRRIDLR